MTKEEFKEKLNFFTKEEIIEAILKRDLTYETKTILQACYEVRRANIKAVNKFLKKIKKVLEKSEKEIKKILHKKPIVSKKEA